MPTLDYDKPTQPQASPLAVNLSALTGIAAAIAAAIFGCLGVLMLVVGLVPHGSALMLIALLAAGVAFILFRWVSRS